MTEGLSPLPFDPNSETFSEANHSNGFYVRFRRSICKEEQESKPLTASTRYDNLCYKASHLKIESKKGRRLEHIVEPKSNQIKSNWAHKYTSTIPVGFKGVQRHGPFRRKLTTQQIWCWTSFKRPVNPSYFRLFNCVAGIFAKHMLNYFLLSGYLLVFTACIAAQRPDCSTAPGRGPSTVVTGRLCSSLGASARGFELDVSFPPKCVTPALAGISYPNIVGRCFKAINPAKQPEWTPPSNWKTYRRDGPRATYRPAKKFKVGDLRAQAMDRNARGKHNVLPKIERPRVRPPPGWRTPIPVGKKQRTWQPPPRKPSPGPSKLRARTMEDEIQRRLLSLLGCVRRCGDPGTISSDPTQCCVLVEEARKSLMCSRTTKILHDLSPSNYPESSRQYAEFTRKLTIGASSNQLLIDPLDD
ncbi:hypothetical protein FA15DRAFT_658909 [Coprinopsis marcescibilis]|uniref:Uncharacterized protein n=1 Tax=Coprinopsis marcescibilis TaxID=230819 RepID=A0A5C3KK85_COPMA|nr:hypothetical protein FA15DRAFT_658909 [Coprinopsis marcescibilis]